MNFTFFVLHCRQTRRLHPVPPSIDNSKRRQPPWSSPNLNLHVPRAATYLPHRITISDTLPAAEVEAVAEPSQSIIRIPPKYRYCHPPNKKTILCHRKWSVGALKRPKCRYKITRLIVGYTTFCQ